MRKYRFRSVCIAAFALVSALTVMKNADAQDKLPTMPGYENYQKARRDRFRRMTLTIPTAWQDGGKALQYRKDGKTYRLDLATKQTTESNTGNAALATNGPRRIGGQIPERGRQYDSSTSPDGKYKAVYRDRNIYLADSAGAKEVAITTQGSEKNRIKYGTASWVYGEELGQSTAMWWSPDGKKLAYYRFDESSVPDYYLSLDMTRLQSKVDTEAYPKAGVPNPVVALFVYDVATKKSLEIDVRDGRPFTNEAIGHYVYKVEWSPDGRELLFNRTNRRQNIMEFTAADPNTGKCRVIVREEWPASWTDNSPEIRWLKDGKRFLWNSYRTGFKNYYLYDISGKLLATLTKHPFEVAGIVRVDEETGTLYYMARSGDNHMKQQLHRVGLDGKGEKRLTDPKYHHTVNLAPDGNHFVDTAQAHDTPPFTQVMDTDGKMVQELSKGDATAVVATSGGKKRVELFTYKAADGVTDLHGLLHFPANFDPNKKYPLLVDVYAGPETNGARETFTTANPITELGFLYATLDSRSAEGRGKKFLDAIYGKLGITEIDDQAAGVKALWSRAYLDKNRVGIFGTSYGGYASAMALLRYPEVFQAACACSAVTAWYHYDTIYTERYMWIPQENKAGYEAGSAMTYADALKGRLMLYFGTADNNVHPSNTMQLIEALQRAGKNFEVQIGPDQGHTAVNNERMMEFFIENLVQKTPGS
jgi:dipeptidyl-peptidase 4